MRNDSARARAETRSPVTTGQTRTTLLTATHLLMEGSGAEIRGDHGGGGHRRSGRKSQASPQRNGAEGTPSTLDSEALPASLHSGPTPPDAFVTSATPP